MKMPVFHWLCRISGGGWAIFFIMLSAALAGCGSDASNNVDPYGDKKFAPVVHSVSPKKVMQGEVVTITGRLFAGDVQGNNVFFAPYEKAVVLTASDTLLTAKVPYTARSGVVYVEKDDLIGVSTESVTIEKVVIDTTKPGPFVEISSFSPVKIRPGFMLRIRGKGFSPVARENFVVLGKTVAEVVSAGWHELVVKVPAGVQPDFIYVRVQSTYTANSSAKYEVYRDGEPSQPISYRVKIHTIGMNFTGRESCSSPGLSGCRENHQGTYYDEIVFDRTFVRKSDGTYRDSYDSSNTITIGNGEISIRRIAGIGYVGTAHCDDISYVAYMSADRLRIRQTGERSFEVAGEELQRAQPRIEVSEVWASTQSGSCRCSCSLSLQSFTYSPNVQCTIEFFYW